MKLFTLASSMLATTTVVVSAAAVAVPVDDSAQLTTSSRSILGDGVYTMDLDDGDNEVFSPVAPQSVHVPQEDQSTHGILKRRGTYEVHCGTKNNDHFVNLNEVNSAKNEMLAVIGTGYTLTNLAVSAQSGGVRFFCCNFNGHKTTWITPELFDDAINAVDRECKGETALGHREPSDKKIPLCGRTYVGDVFCHPKNRG